MTISLLMAIATLIRAQQVIVHETIPMMHTTMVQGIAFIRVLEVASTMLMGTETRYTSPSEAIPVDGKKDFQQRITTLKKL